MTTWRGMTVAAMAAFAIGCGESGPALVPVSGVVTLNGKPFEGAVITFHPDPSNKQGLPGEDMTGPSGNYKAMTKGRSGLVPGKYKVVVTKSLIDPKKIPESFKDDPFMGQLSVQGPDVGLGKGKPDPSGEIEYRFDREIPPEGGPQDFDAKVKTSVAASAEKSS